MSSTRCAGCPLRMENVYIYFALWISLNLMEKAAADKTADKGEG